MNKEDEANFDHRNFEKDLSSVVANLMDLQRRYPQLFYRISNLIRDVGDLSIYVRDELDEKKS